MTSAYTVLHIAQNGIPFFSGLVLVLKRFGFRSQQAKANL